MHSLVIVIRVVIHCSVGSRAELAGGGVNGSERGPWARGLRGFRGGGEGGGGRGNARVCGDSAPDAGRGRGGLGHR